MAINVTIARGYAWRMIIIGAACVVLGAWGVYDYVVDIPRRQKLLERQVLLELCRDALETEQAAAALTPEEQAAMEAITTEAERIMRRELGETLNDTQAPLTPEQQAELQQKFAQALGTSEDAEWLALLGAITQGGMGLAAGGNINPEGVSMFEPIGGSAPKYTGQGVINPLAAICAMAMMLETLGEQDAADAATLYRLLEDQVVPLFYKRDADDVPRGWVQVMKEAIRTSVPIFCTRRMVKEYTERFYIPAAKRAAPR